MSPPAAWAVLAERTWPWAEAGWAPAPEEARSGNKVATG